MRARTEPIMYGIWDWGEECPMAWQMYAMLSTMGGGLGGRWKI